MWRMSVVLDDVAAEIGRHFAEYFRLTVHVEFDDKRSRITSHRIAQDEHFLLHSTQTENTRVRFVVFENVVCYVDTGKMATHVNTKLTVASPFAVRHVHRVRVILIVPVKQFIRPF